ncbi:MAG: branched-chain amino acid ABC transporter substrate-binding protein [Jiangellaceae bacterium]
MRSTRLGKIAAASAAVLLFAAACGDDDDGNGTTAPENGDSEAACDLSLAFFGALTGDAANLGINIRNGVELAIDQYNEENADCEVNLVELDSQGSPDQAPALAQEAINDETVVGIIGPAFSGESAAANPLFEEAGLPIISASATNPDLAGPDIFHRLVANDGAQGPAVASYIRDIAGAQAVFVVDDSSEYGLGLADIVRSDLGDLVVGNDAVQAGQTDFSATVTAIRGANADAVFFGGYYTEAGLLTAQLRSAGITATFVSGDGSKDPGFVDAAGAEAAEGAILTCPCFPPDQASGTFFDDYEAAYGSAAGTYSAEGFDATSVFLDAIEAGNSTREDVLTFIDEYNEEGITSQIEFAEDGEIATVSIWAYRVEGGEVLGDQVIEVE